MLEPFASIFFYARWSIAGFLALFGLAVIVANWSIVVNNFRPHEHWRSIIPFVGGLALAGALLVVPVDGLWVWAWVPLLLDAGGCGMILVGFVLLLLRKRG